MTYQEKVKFAEEVVVEMKNKTSIEKIKGQLISNGLFSADVEKILFSAKGILEEEYGVKLKEYMIAGTLEQKKSEFVLLDESVFENIKERSRCIIIEETAQKVKKLASEGKSDSDIISATITPYVTENEIRMQIENYRQYIETPKGEERNKYMLIGFACFVPGLMVLLYKFIYGGRIGFGGALVGFGIYNLYKAFTPKGVADVYLRNK